MSNLASLFQPKTVAIVGASGNPDKLGNVIVKNMIYCGFAGHIYPVNPREQEIEGLKCYQQISQLPEPVDVAVISVPAARAISVAEQCGQAGVKHLIVITAGFKEVGSEGLKLEKELVAICKKHGMHMLGPNCVGLFDTHTPLNATFSGVYPHKGNIAFISQSGAFLVAILDWCFNTGLGFSRLVSLGNKAELNEADFIEEVARDDQSKVILCYIEDVVEGARFMRVAREASEKKPVIILKSGTSQAGARAASSHTGALAGSDIAYTAAFNQSGIIRASSMEELFDLAFAFAHQPLPKGNRVAVVTNAGGPGIVATDRIEKIGLKMASFSNETINCLREFMPAESNIYNPVDVLGDALIDRYQRAMAAALSDPGVDALLFLTCPSAVFGSAEIARALIETAKIQKDKPVVAAFIGGPRLTSGMDLLRKNGVPVFSFPEPAIRAIKGLYEYHSFKAGAASQEPLRYSDIDRKAVEDLISRVKKERRPVLLGSEAAELVSAYGIPATPTRLATSPEEAAQMAEEMGYPVVLKVASPQIMHKTDVGGVLAGLQSGREVIDGYRAIMNNVAEHFPLSVIYGIEVQKMMPPGIELIIGASRDIHFGHLLAFGLGGIYVNLLRDVSFRLSRELSLPDIEKMIKETKAYSLIRGYRGKEPGDFGALVDIIGRVAVLVNDFPEISEMDINPVFLYTSGLSALDIKITISQP